MSETPSKESAGNAEAGGKAASAGEGGRGKGRRRGRGRGGRDGDKPRDGDKKPREGKKGDGRKGGPRGRKGGGRGRDGRRGRDNDRGSGTLTAGLFASVADKEVPCRVSGCKNTWTWWGSEQIKAFGQPPPKRMCDEHLAAFHELEDKEIACRNSGCDNTWTWKRGAQLHQLQRTEKLKTPRRLCEKCAGEEKNVTDMQVECRVPGCEHTWTWPADAQRRHAAWLRREKAKLEAAESGEAESDAPVEAKGEEPTETPAAEAPVPEAPAAEAPEVAAAAEAPAAEAPAAEAAAEEAKAEGDASEAAASSGAAPEGEAAVEAAPKKKKKRRRKKGKQKKLQEGPPEKLCQGCSDQIKAFAPQEQPCKVHGCKETWSWDREHQLRAWVHAGRPEDPSVTKPLKNQRRMCNSCRDFCRGTKDRDVVCGKPECEKTWKYKTGAQLQDKLAGRTADPIKLCEDCMKEQFVAPGVHTGALPEGSEVMPCGSAGCEGTWIYVPGMELQSAEGDEVPPDRMCDKCRGERGLPGRGVVVQSPDAVAAAEASAPETAANEAEAANEGEPDPTPEAQAAAEPVAEATAEPEPPASIDVNDESDN